MQEAFRLPEIVYHRLILIPNLVGQFIHFIHYSINVAQNIPAILYSIDKKEKQVEAKAIEEFCTLNKGLWCEALLFV